MKVKKRLQHFRNNRKTCGSTDDSIRSFMLITVCAVGAVFLAVGSKVVDSSENGKVYAAEADFQADFLPTGIAGVITGVRGTASSERAVERIGTSCEQVMVGQRVKRVSDQVTEFNVSTSLEKSIDEFSQKSMALAAAPMMMSDTDYENLLHIVEAEAGTEDIKGRVLVANVIMNRVKHEEFPDTITEVVWDSSNGVPQFSPTYDGAIYRVTVSDDTREAVKQALEGVDYSEGALFFVQKSAAEEQAVSWFEKDLKRLFKHGCHEFYTYPEETENNSDSEKEVKPQADDNIVQMVKNDAN